MANTRYINRTELTDLSDKMDDMKNTMEKLINGQFQDLRRNFEKQICGLEKIITAQRKEITGLKETVAKLEDRVEDLEQYTRKEDIIVTGLRITRSFSDALKGESEEPSRVDSISVEDQVIEQLNSRK